MAAQSWTLQSIAESADRRLDEDAIRFTSVVGGAQLERLAKTSGEKSPTRSTAIWVLSRMFKYIRRALERSGLAVEEFERELGVSALPRSSGRSDPELHSDFATAMLEYVRSHPSGAPIGPFDVAIAILESADRGESTLLPTRLRSHGLDIPKALGRLRQGRAARRGESTDPDSQQTGQTFSSTVRTVRGQLGAGSLVSASEIARAIASLHDEYAGGLIKSVAFPSESSDRRPVDLWLAAAESLYPVEDLDAAGMEVIDGRLVLLALAELDYELSAALDDGGCLEKLREEVTLQPFSEKPARPTLQMLADRPIDDESDDVLGFGPYVTAFTALLANESTATPLTVAVTGPWGSGKTSLANMTVSRLRRYLKSQHRPEPLIVWFNAWANDSAENLGLALAAVTTAKVAKERGPGSRLLRPLPASLLDARGRYRRKALRTLAVILIVMLFVAVFRNAIEGTNVDLQEDLVARFGQLGAVLALLWLGISAWGQLNGVAQAVGRFVTSPRTEASSGATSEVSRELGDLIKDVLGKGGRRLIVFVDDLERCEPPRSIEVCEVAHQLLNHANVIVVYLADMDSIAAAAEIKYADLAKRLAKAPSRGAGDGNGTSSWGREYLHKIVQFQFAVPSADQDALEKLVATQPGSEHSGDAPPLSDESTPSQAADAEAAPGRDTEAEEPVSASDPPDQGVAAQELAETLTREDSRVMAAAESLVLDHIPRNPRIVKNILNRLRFLMIIWHDRGLLDNNPARNARLVGKWSLLFERWPEVAQFAQEDSALLKELQRIATGEDSKAELQRFVDDRGIRLDDLEDLEALLKVTPLFGA